MKKRLSLFLISILVVLVTIDGVLVYKFGYSIGKIDCYLDHISQSLSAIETELP